jgi:hypothetical protein
LQDCIPGQKWKCVYEDSRWRKHKCKFHKEVQDHLAEINKYLSAQQQQRNCACFTPNGLVYTKIKAEREVFPQKQKRFDTHRHRNGRHKREADFEEIFNEKLPPEFINLLQMDQVLDNIQNSLENSNEHSRKKREADYITQTIDELHSVLLTLEKKYLNNTKGPVQCFVESSGKVNCSTIVYENEEAWRQSRIQIDMLIKVLKDKIANLKDIKKHLREHRPTNMTSTDEDAYVSSTEDNLESSDELDVEEFSKKKQQSRHRHQERRKRPKSTTTTAATEDDFSANSTTDDDEIFNSSSITPQSVTESTTLLRQPQRTRLRTKIPKISTSTAETTEEPATSQSYDQITSESDILSSSEFSPTSNFDEITSESTLTEILSTTTMKPVKTQLSENNVNHALNTTNTMQAECYCASKFER